MQNKLIEKLNILCPHQSYEIGVGFLDSLLGENYRHYPYGLSILRKLDDKIINAISQGPTPAYRNLYHQINSELNQKCHEIAQLLQSAGIQSLAVKATVSDEDLDEDFDRTLSVPISHKMIATRAGLGWIGKTDLLISKRFGPRVRLASVLMDQALGKTGTPILSSQCGNCSLCIKACPVQAANGKAWNIKVNRDSFYNAFKCREYCQKISKENLQEKISICGICMSICPHGKS